MRTNLKTILILFIFCLLISSCTDNREAFLEEYLQTADEIVKIVDADPTAAGVAKAEEFLNTKKPSLKSKFDAGKSQGDMDDKVKDRFATSVGIQIRKLENLSTKHPNLKNELDKLTTNFSEFLLK